MIKLNLKDSYQFVFWEESKNQIACIERELLSVEAQNYDDETITLIFRMAHSLKGSSATMEIKEMMRIAHVLEDLLTPLKNQHILLSPEVMALLLDSIDILKWLHELLTLDTSYTQDLLDTIESTISDIETRIQKVMHLEQPLNAFKENLKQMPDTISVWNNDRLEQGVIEVHVTFEFDAEMLSVKAYMIKQALLKCGTLIKTHPDAFENCEDTVFNRQFQVYMQTEQSEEEIINALLSISELKSVDVKTKPTEPMNTTKSKLSKPLNSVAIDVTSVRIPIQKINQLINLVGELTLNKEILFDVTKALKRTYKKDKQIARLEETCESIQFLGSELQEIVLTARLIPLEVVFNKFPRMVRDLAIESNKKIRLEIEGLDQGIDRSIIEELSDPLMHLIRNAIDHGIEAPEVRKHKGKPPEGLLKITARQGENQVVISIEDDGNGIDLEKIKYIALSKELISIEEATHLNDSEWLEFIFKPGFSTANSVTTLSGRGVGLDVVKSNITKINGHLDILTTAGIGSKFVIKLPLTMAIMNVLLVKESTCIFGIPTSQIVEIVRLTKSEFSEKIYSTAYSDVLNWQGTTLPLIKLSKVFELETIKEPNKLLILILGTGERKIALTVGGILGEQEVVIKPMQAFIGENKIFGALNEISGVSVLGNGSLAQIIDSAMFNKILNA